MGSVIRRSGNALACVVLTVLYFKWTAFAGYAPIDFARFLTSAHAAVEHTSAVGVIGAMVRAGTAAGSLGPLAVLPLLIWLAAPSPLVVVSVHAALVVANFATLSAFVRRLSGSGLAGLVVVVFSLCAVQFRIAGDPFNSNLVVIPAAAECVLLALFCYAGQVGGAGSVARSYFSVPLFVVAVALVPPFALAAPAFVVLAPHAWGERPRTLERGFYAVVAVLATAFFAVRFVGHDLEAVRATFASVAGALPLVYRASGAILRDRLSPTGRDLSYDDVPAVHTLDWAFAIGCAALVGVAFARLGTARRDLRLLVFGVALWIAPALFPVYGLYLSTFGVGIVLYAIVRTFATSPTAVQVGAATAALAVFFVIYGNLRMNVYVAAIVARPWASFELIRDAASLGFFRFVPDGAAVSLSTNDPAAAYVRDGNASVFFEAAAGRVFRPGRSVGSWLVARKDERASFASLQLVPLEHRMRDDWTTDRGRQYYRFASEGSLRKFLETTSAVTTGIRFSFDRVDRQNVLVDAERTCGPVALDKILEPDIPTVIWSDGFAPYERPVPKLLPRAEELTAAYEYVSDPPWRFASSRALLHVSPDACGRVRGENVRLKLVLYAGYPGTVDIFAGGSAPLIRPVGPNPHEVTLDVPAGGGASGDVSFHFYVDAVPQDPLIPRTDNDPPRGVVAAVEMRSVLVTDRGVANRESSP